VGNIMSNPLKLILIVSLLLYISGCSYYIVSFKDVSNELPYSKVVNLTFETKCELLIDGYNLDSIPGKEIHQYAIKSPPIAKTRYILSRDKIPIGTLLTLTTVKRCTDCFLDFKPRIKIEVTSIDLKQEYDVPIVIDDELLVNNWGKSGDNIQFNTEYLLLVDEKY
jgi:hypothetical protein